MKKHIRFGIVGCTCLLLAGISGCGSVDRETQESYRKLGIRKLQEQDYQAAEENFQKALNESKGKIGAVELDICYYKALSQFRSGDIKGAIETYDGLIQYDDKNADAYFLRGSACLQDDQGQKCIQDYNRALALEPDNYTLYIEIYENLCAFGYESRGESYLKKALSREASDGEEFCGQGQIYMLLEDYENADEMLNKALKKGYDKAMVYQAQILKARGDEDAAYRLYEMYIEKYPEDIDALNEIGVIEMHAKDYKAALEAFEKAAALDPKGENQSLRLNLIYAYEYNGEFQKAYELMKSYVKDYPKDTQAQKEYIFLKSRAAGQEQPKEEKTDSQKDTDGTSENEQTEG